MELSQFGGRKRRISRSLSPTRGGSTSPGNVVDMGEKTAENCGRGRRGRRRGKPGKPGKPQVSGSRWTTSNTIFNVHGYLLKLAKLFRTSSLLLSFHWPPKKAKPYSTLWAHFYSANRGYMRWTLSGSIHWMKLRLVAWEQRRWSSEWILFPWLTWYSLLQK